MGEAARLIQDLSESLRREEFTSRSAEPAKTVDCDSLLPTFLKANPPPNPTTEPTLAGGQPGKPGEMPRLIGESRSLGGAVGLILVGMILGVFWSGVVMYLAHMHP